MNGTSVGAILNPTLPLTCTLHRGQSTWAIGFSSTAPQVLCLTHSLWTLPQSVISLTFILSALRQTFLAGRSGSDV